MLTVVTATLISALALSDTCAKGLGRSANYWTIEKLKIESRNPDTIKKFDGSAITIRGLVHTYASGSIELDLRPNALALIGSDDENPPIDGCVGLIVPRRLFEGIRGHRKLEVHGRIVVIENPTSFVTSYEYKGIRFYPKCGYFLPRAPYIYVDRAKMIRDRTLPPSHG